MRRGGRCFWNKNKFHSSNLHKLQNYKHTHVKHFFIIVSLYYKNDDFLRSYNLMKRLKNMSELKVKVRRRFFGCIQSLVTQKLLLKKSVLKTMTWKRNKEGLKHYLFTAFEGITLCVCVMNLLDES